MPQRGEPPAYPRPRLLVPQTEAERQLRERIEEGKQILAVRISRQDDLDQAEAHFDRWNGYNKELLLTIFDNPGPGKEYGREFAWTVGGADFSFYVRRFHDRVRERINRLESLVERLKLYQEVPQVTTATTPTGIPGKDVFVVHGHDEATKDAVRAFLYRIGLNPIVLHELPSKGRTIIEKLEDHAATAYGVVTLTPDDEGRLAYGIPEAEREPLRFRARQNVILELGYFLAKLGRDRVCVLLRGDVERPSDYQGVIYVAWDDPKGWDRLLFRELQAAGMAVDATKL
jgi:predicted nucleotide-binding protein